MKYILYFSLFITYFPTSLAQQLIPTTTTIPSIKIRKRQIQPTFSQALALPRTATSCNCPTNQNRTLTKLGCQHPDTVAVCKVVITQFDVAMIPENGDAIIIKEIKGSFLNSNALNAIRSYRGNNAFISYTNIKGMTNDGKEVVIPSFGTQTPNKRAHRSYNSIYNYLSHINMTNTKIHSFELSAYNADNRLIFRQSYTKDSFDKNAMRPDAVRYVFRDIKAKHSSGFDVEVDNFEVSNIELPEEQLLSSNN